MNLNVYTNTCWIKDKKIEIPLLSSFFRRDDDPERHRNVDPIQSQRQTDLRKKERKRTESRIASSKCLDSIEIDGHVKIIARDDAFFLTSEQNPVCKSTLHVWPDLPLYTSRVLGEKKRSTAKAERRKAEKAACANGIFAILSKQPFILQVRRNDEIKKWVNIHKLPSVNRTRRAEPAHLYV